MNRVSQLFTKKFIATALLSFNGIDTYFQTFRYFFPSIPFDSQQNDPALLRRKFFNMDIQLTDDLFFHCQCINHILVLPTFFSKGT